MKRNALLTVKPEERKPTLVISSVNRRLTKATSDLIQKEADCERLEIKAKEAELKAHELTLEKNTLETENSLLKKQIEKLESEISESSRLFETRKDTAQQEVAKLTTEQRNEREQWEKMRESKFISTI